MSDWRKKQAAEWRARVETAVDRVVLESTLDDLAAYAWAVRDRLPGGIIGKREIQRDMLHWARVEIAQRIIDGVLPI